MAGDDPDDDADDAAPDPAPDAARESERARDALARVDVAVLGRRVARYQKEIYDYGTSYVPAIPTWGTQSLGHWLQVRDPAVRGAQRWAQSFIQTSSERAAADAPTRHARAAAWQDEAHRPEVAAALGLRERLAARDVPVPDGPLRAGLEAAWAPDAGRVTVTRRALAACLHHESCDDASIELADPTQPLARCRYAADRPCTLKLMAVEALLDLLMPSTPANPLRDYVTRPAWQRLVDRLAVVGQTKDLALRPVEPEAHLGWVVTADDVELAWVRPKKRQDGLTADRLGATSKELDQLLEDARDRVALALARAERTQPPSARTGPILSALVGHPSVYLKHEGELLPVHVVASDPALGLAATADGDAVMVVRLAGAELGLASAPRAGEWLIVPRPEAREVVVGRWTRAAVLAWDAWAKAPMPVPAAGRDALAQALVGLMADVPVALDGAWLGVAHPPADVVVFRLGFVGTRKARVLTIDGLVEPVPELPPRAPATGPEVVPVRRAPAAELGLPLSPALAHVRRDFTRELARVHEVAALAGLDPDVHAWRIDHLDRALEVVRALDEAARAGRVRLVWQTRPPAVTRGAKSDRLRLAVGPRKDWLGLTGGLVVEGAELPLAELLEALRDRRRWVALDDDRFVELDEELRQRLAPLAALARTERGAVGASPLAAALLGELESAGATIDAPAEWLAQRARIDAARHLEVPLPAGLMAELRPYQVEGFVWMARLATWARGACLADDMGLGKTLMALALLLHRAPAGPALVIAPTSVVPNWLRESARFAPSLAPVVVAGQGALDRIDGARCVITTYDVLVRNEPAFAGRAFATLVLDEAHAIKNAATKRAQAVKALDYQFALALTGTPVENRPGELWSLFQVVAPGLLGSAETFRDDLLRGADALPRLTRLVQPFILRRTKAAVAPDLPPRVEVRVDVVLPPDERDRYERLRRSALAELRTPGPDSSGAPAAPPAGGRGIVKILSVLVRLRQLACHPRLVDPLAPPQSAKLERLVALVEELRAESRRVLVFSQFTELLALVREAFDLASVSYTYLDGQTPSAERQRAVDRFQAGAVDAFLLSLKAGGVGLNLTAASEVVLLDPWWNPAVEDQAADRAHRIGQDKAVTIYRLVASDTIEDKILELHADKRALVSSLLDGTSAARALSADELMALVADEGG